MAVHHLIAIYWLFILTKDFHIETANFFITEASTPFINICFYEKQVGRDGGLVFIGSGIVAWNLFLWTRLINMAITVFLMWERVESYKRALMVLLLAMNSVWFAKITKMLYNTIK
jgi:hypothetical protein